jgi:heme exporter protein C
VTCVSASDTPHDPTADAGPGPRAAGLDRLAARLRAPSGAVLAVLTVVYLGSVVRAPLDAAQGVIAKILFLHPPLAFGAYLGFLLAALSSALYLWRRDEQFDRFALSAAEVGVVFCSLMMLTGPIWAKGTWGKWWSWDPRLTVTLLLWFVYLAYLLLRSFSEGGERTARFAAVYAIVGVLLIPLNYWVIELFGNRTMHPQNLERGSLGPGMGLPFLMGNLFCLTAFVHLLARRTELESLRHAARLAWTREGDA